MSDEQAPVVQTIHENGVAVIGLAAPKRGNALSSALVAALDDAIDRAIGNADVHTMLFYGEGKHFCTGFDLSDLEVVSDGDLLARFVAIELLLQKIWLAPLRTAAIAHGSTFGAGADLFAACDVRLVHDAGRFRFPGAGFGLVLGTRRLAERVGTDAARDWVTHGLTIDADTALASGFATTSVSSASEPGAALPDLEQVWAHIGSRPRIDRQTQAAIHRASRADFSDADLAALVRSAARPGVKARIVHYREALAREAAASKASQS